MAAVIREQRARVEPRPQVKPSPEQMRAITLEMAEKHRRSLELLEAYDRGEIKAPRRRRSAKA